MARPSNRSERRQQIAEALLHVMARQGYEGATIAEIARQAQLTPGLVHYHFGSKLEVLLALLELIAERHLERLIAAVEAAGPSPHARLAAFLDVHLATGATADADALAGWIVLGGESLRNAEVRTAYHEALGHNRDVLREIIRDGVAMGEMACDDVDAASGALIALIQGYFDVAAVARDLIPHRSAAPMARRMAEGLLGVGATRQEVAPPVE